MRQSAQALQAVQTEWEEHHDETYNQAFWYNTTTGECTWERPAELAQAVSQPSRWQAAAAHTTDRPAQIAAQFAVAIAGEGVASCSSGRQTEGGARRPSTIGANIDFMITGDGSSAYRGRIDPYILRPWKRVPPAPPAVGEDTPPPPPKPPWWSPRLWAMTLVGSVFYGILFVPFIFAILQEAASEGRAITPFGSEVFVSHRSWVASFVFLATVAVYSMAVFNMVLSDYMYSLLLLSIVLLVLLQQALTWRYIQLMPEQSEAPVKDRDTEYHIIGKAYSTMHPRAWVNYIQFSMVFAEFFQMISVTFQPYVGWRDVGSREEDGWLVCGVQSFLREFVGYSVDQVLLALLVTFTTLYLLLIGEFVYSERQPYSAAGALMCDFFAGTCYVTVITRLLGVADSIQDSHQRTVAVLAYFVYTSTATFVATLRSGDKVTKDCQTRFMPKWVVLERILKGTLGIATVLCRHISPLYSQCDFEYVIDTGGVYNYNAYIATGIDYSVGADAPSDTSLAPPPPPPPRRDCTGMEGAGYLACCEGLRLGGLVLISWAILINLTHMFFLRRWDTCSVTFVTRLRLGLLGLAFFGQTVTLFMILLQWDGWFLVLCIGGFLALLGLIGLTVYKVCFAPPPEHETEQVRLDRIKKAHAKMPKKGYSRKGVFGTGDS